MNPCDQRPHGDLSHKDTPYTLRIGKVRVMTAKEATAEVFWIAFRALPKKERAAVVEKLLKDKEFMEDLIDMVTIEQRRKEPSRPLDEYMTDSRKKRA